MSDNLYFDNAATTTARPEVIEAMVPLLAGGYNPSSTHAHGRAARAALDDARAEVARVLGAAPREIVFTGGGSEADVLAIVGAAKARAADGKHIVTASFEHHAVLHAADVLEGDGWSVTRLGVSPDGLVDPAAVAAALRADTTLVSIMLGNNEVGTIQPIAEIAAVAHAGGALMHTDAVQCAGYLDLDVNRLGVDLMAISAHKFSGPKGVGVLFVRRGTPVTAQIVGGGQEHGLRSGTENLAGVAGLARALTLAEAERPAAAARVARLRDRLADAIRDARSRHAGARRRCAPAAAHLERRLPQSALGCAAHGARLGGRFSVGGKRVCCRITRTESRRCRVGSRPRVCNRRFAVFFG